VVLGEHLTQVGHHQGRGVAEQVEQADQARAGLQRDPVRGRRAVSGQVEQVRAFVVGQAQRAGQCTQ
jgi:hypothetical protein